MSEPAIPKTTAKEIPSAAETPFRDTTEFAAIGSAAFLATALALNYAMPKVVSKAGRIGSRRKLKTKLAQENRTGSDEERKINNVFYKIVESNDLK